MSEPLFGGRQAQPLDDMIARAGGEGWAGLEALFEPHVQRSQLQPSDRVAQNIARLVGHRDGREIIEWLMDITLRQPYRVTGKSLEETALRSAQRQGINGVGEAVLAAIAHGQNVQEKS